MEFANGEKIDSYLRTSSSNRLIYDNMRRKMLPYHQRSWSCIKLFRTFISTSRNKGLRASVLGRSQGPRVKTQQQTLWRKAQRNRCDHPQARSTQFRPPVNFPLSCLIRRWSTHDIGSSGSNYNDPRNIKFFMCQDSCILFIPRSYYFSFIHWVGR